MHKNLLKLLRISGRVDVKREFDDKKVAVLQEFVANSIEEPKRATIQLMKFARQHNVADQRDEFIASNFIRDRYGPTWTYGTGFTWE